MPYFSAFLFGFYNVSAIQVPLQQQQVAKAVIAVAIFELLFLGWIARNIKSDNVIRQIWNIRTSDWLNKYAITAPKSVQFENNCTLFCRGNRI